VVPDGKYTDRFNDYYSYMAIREDYSFLFRALRNIDLPRKHPYLLVNTELGPQVFYVFDPYSREEVQFYRFYRKGLVSYEMEQICSYSVYTDSTYAMINGLDKSLVKSRHYDIDARIGSGGDFAAKATLDFEVQVTHTQLLEFSLHDHLTVDSIRDSHGGPATFFRFTKISHRSLPLYVILPEPLSAGDKDSLTVYYHGDIIRQRVGEMYVTASGSWYPRYNPGYVQPTTFDMSFVTPSRYGFVACGRKLSSVTNGDSLITSWEVDSPVREVSFNIGNFAQFEFSVANLPIVDVYYLQQFHRDSALRIMQSLRQDTARALDFSYGDTSSADTLVYIPSGKQMERQVATDIVGSLRLFSERYGPYPFSRLDVSEILTGREEAFPGLLDLGFSTFLNSSPFGDDNRVRATGVAQQWWQQAMYPETYHDEWLFDGISLYSALWYLQVSEGNDRFDYWMDQYRKQIVSLNRYLLNKRQQAGPVALGSRTATTKSPNDYQLIVFQKGAYIIHMLRNILLDFGTLNEDRFFDMMKDFYATFRGRPVTTRDFEDVVEKHVGQDMSWFFDEWVYGSEIPTYDFDCKVAQNPRKGYDITFHVKEKDVPTSFKMYVPIEIDSESGQKSFIRVLVDKPDLEQTITVESKPDKVTLNPFQSVLANVNQ
jgi:hypothetical protein